jgi:hypothetical protein
VIFTPRFSNLAFRFSPFDCIPLLLAPNSVYIQSLFYQARRWLMKDVRSEKTAGRSLAGAEQGSEQSRPTGLLRPPDAAKCSPILRPSAARIILADHSLRRGTACCARCSAADRRHPLADTRSKPISTRFCPKSRSHTKHTTKPSLPGSRFAHCHPRTSFATSLSNRELQLLERTLTHRKQTIAPRSNRELSTNPVTLTLASTWHRMTGNQ